MRHYRTNGTRFMKLAIKSLKLIHINNKPIHSNCDWFFKEVYFRRNLKTGHFILFRLAYIHVLERNFLDDKN
jgi:hypothetical protein